MKRKPGGQFVPIENRFWTKVKMGSPEECWEWTAGLQDGYGRISLILDGKKHMILAHRLAWKLTYGSEPSECVLHKCDNRKCCNPSHLWLGSREDNNKDCWSKNRQGCGKNPVKGEACGASRLTEQQVQTIRIRLQNGEVQRRIAADFNVSPATIHRIYHNVCWKTGG